MSSNVTLRSFKFSDLFSLEPVKKTRLKEGHPFSFYSKAKNNKIEGSTGRGIYFFAEKITGKWRLIYVGIHADKGNKCFHQQRIKKHLVTDTFRLIDLGPRGGKQPAGFGYSTNKQLNENDLYEILKDILFNGRTYRRENLTKDMELIKLILKNPNWWSWRLRASGECPEPRTWENFQNFNPTGIETSGKRFAYVCSNWDYFKDDANITKDKFNANYQFYFMQFKDELFNGLDDKTSKRWLADIEDQIVLEFNPIINERGEGNVEERILSWKKKKTELSSLSNEIYAFTIKCNSFRSIFR